MDVTLLDKANYRLLWPLFWPLLLLLATAGQFLGQRAALGPSPGGRQKAMRFGLSGLLGGRPGRKRVERPVRLVVASGLGPLQAHAAGNGIAAAEQEAAEGTCLPATVPAAERTTTATILTSVGLDTQGTDICVTVRLRR